MSITRKLLLTAVLLTLPAAGPAQAQTPAEAYAQGCGRCHQSERVVLRAIPRTPDAERRAWIEHFMALHPCERDALKPLIMQYLLEKSRR